MGRLGWFLAASLGVNVLLAGFVVAGFNPQHNKAEQVMVERLGPDKVKNFKKAMRAIDTAHRNEMHDLKNLRKELREMMVEPNFNADEYRQKATAVASIQTRASQARVELFLQGIEGLDEPQREAVAAYLAERRKRFKR